MQGPRPASTRVAPRARIAATVASTEPRAEDAAAVDEDASATRLHKGELSTLVIDYLKAHGDDAIGPSAIGKGLSRSSGAVANACQRRESSGSPRLVSDSPRRYQIADA